MPRVTKQATIEAQAQEILKLEQELFKLNGLVYPSPLSSTRVAPSWKARYIQSQAEKIEALKQELEQAKQAQAQEQEQAYIKALAKLDLEKKELQAELTYSQASLKVAQADVKGLRAYIEAEQAQADEKLGQAKQEIEALKAELTQAQAELEAEQEKHKQALAREKGLRADIEGTSLQLEQVQAELAQAYEQGEQEYQAIRLELVQAKQDLTRVKLGFDRCKAELEQAQACSKIEQYKQELEQGLWVLPPSLEAWRVFWKSHYQAELEALKLEASKAWGAWHECCIQLQEQALEHHNQAELEQELVYHKLELAWVLGQALDIKAVEKLQELRKALNKVTPEKQAEQAQELDLSWD